MLFTNGLIHRSLMRRHMRPSAVGARGIPSGTARRIARIFDAAYGKATRFSTDVEHQRSAVRRALGLG